MNPSYLFAAPTTELNVCGGTESSVGSSVNILSKYLKSLIPESFGLNGASIALFLSFSQSILSKKGCFLISTVLAGLRFGYITLTSTCNNERKRSTA